MKRIFLLLLFTLAPVLVNPPAATAQSVTVTTSSLQDGAAAANGKLCWIPVTPSGIPTPYRRGMGGMSSVTPLCATVTNGASSLATLPDSCFTTPAYLCFRVVLDTGNGSTLLSNCVQPSASNYWYAGGVDNFDNWQPNGAALTGAACGLFEIDANGSLVAQALTIGISVGGTSVASATSISSISFDAGDLFAFYANGSLVAQASTVAVSVGGASVASVTSISSISVNGSVL